MAKDIATEHWLNSHGVQWHYEAKVPLADVDRDASLKNQARDQALDYNHVIDIALAVLDGAVLPAIVGHRDKKQKVVIIDGNHRFVAFIDEVKIAESDFYIVDNPYEWLIVRLTITANVRNGIPLTRAERLNRALFLVKTQNLTVNAAARMMGLSESAVQSLIEANTIRERLGKMGFSEILPVTHCTVLYRVKQDKALIGAALLVKEARLSAEETRELAARLEKTATSEKQQATVLKAFTERFAERVALHGKGKVTYKRTPKRRAREAMNCIHSIAGRPESLVPFEDTLRRLIRRTVKDLEGLVKYAEQH